MARQDHMTQDEYDDAVERLMGGDDSKGVPDEALEADDELGREWLVNVYWPRLRAALAVHNLTPEDFSSDARARVYVGTLDGVDPVDRSPRRFTHFAPGSPACADFARKWWGPDRNNNRRIAAALTAALDAEQRDAADRDIRRGYSEK